MTPTLDRPRRSPARPGPRRIVDRRSRDHFERDAALAVQAREPGRISLCCGCHLIGWYSPDALADVLDDLARWALDPAARDALPWPRLCGPWEWRPGETLAVWCGGQVLALVTKPAAGEPIVTRLDRTVAPE